MPTGDFGDGWNVVPDFNICKWCTRSPFDSIHIYVNLEKLLLLSVLSQHWRRHTAYSSEHWPVAW